MSVTSGFYDSLNGDRRYAAKEMSAIFDGIINDGVLANIGEAFAVKAEPGNRVTVGIGRAWFNSTWVYNDSVITLTVPELSGQATRSDGYAADVLVLEVDRSEAVRKATIKFVDQYGGVFPMVNPITKDDILRNAVQRLTNTAEVHQYPLAVIYRVGGSTDDIIQANITNYIGTSNCPYVTGILQVQHIDNIVAQWQSEFETWFASVRSTLDGDVASILTAKVTAFEQGTTPAGNASKLGGQAPSYYAKATDVTNIVSGATSVGNASKLGGSAAADYAKKTDLKAENITAGYFPGVMRASPTAVATIGDSMLRNIYAGTSDMTAGTTTLASGAIYVVYE